MRKLLFLFLVILPLALVGCGGGESGQTSSSNDSTAAESAEKQGEQANEPAEEEKSLKIGDEISLDDGAYLVKINRISRSKDHEGKPVVVIDYTFTNSSQETSSALASVFFSVFQDGVELELGLFVDGVNGENGLKDIRPGNSIDCQTSYIMTSENEIEIEVSSMAEMFSGNHALLKVEAPK